MISGFQTSLFGAGLVSGVAGQNSGYVEYYRGFLKGEGVLRCRLVGKCIEPSILKSELIQCQHSTSAGIAIPCERDLNMLLVDRKAEI